MAPIFLHCSKQVYSHPFYKTAVTFSINKSDKVTSVSQSLKDDTLRLFDIRNEIKVIPNFIELNVDKTDVNSCKRSVMAKPDERILTHISNFRKDKNIPDVIHVFNLVQKQIKAKFYVKVDCFYMVYFNIFVHTEHAFCIADI